MRGRTRTLLAGASIIALGLSTTAMAAEPDSADVSEVVVTGTRLQLNGNAAPTPVTVASAEALERASPTTLSAGLNQLPQFAGSRTPSSGAGSSGNVAGGVGTIGNVLNLRSVGPLRTLVLMDNRRLAPTSFTEQVSVDVVPELLVKRVEVVTGGVSAVYGSDAVAGVVNYIIDEEFTGIRGRAQAGISDYSDTKTWKAGLAVGKALLDGRAHVLASYEHQQNGRVPRGNRPYGTDGFGHVAQNADPAFLARSPAGTAENPYVTVPNLRNNQRGYNALFLTGPAGVSRFQVLADGRTLVPFNAGTPTSNTTYSIGGDGLPISRDWGLIEGFKSDQGYARVSYDLTDDITAYVSGRYSKLSSIIPAQPIATQVTIFAGNPFLPASVQAALPAGSSVTVGRFFSAVGTGVPNVINTVSNRTYEFAAGLRGKIGADYDFDLSYARSRARDKQDSQGQYYNQHYLAAIDAVTDSAGRIVCRIDTLPASERPRGYTGGCVPFNIFGDTNSAAAVDYVFGTSSYRSTFVTDDVAATISGQPFSLWAGPVGVSVNAEYRKSRLDLDSNGDPNVPPDFTGIRGGNLGVLASSGRLSPWYLTNQPAIHGRVSVKEVSGEASVPLARDLRFVRSLDVTGAVRYTDYSTSGGVTTWKAGLSYQPVEDLRFRVTRSRDIRAPTLNQQFAGITASLATLLDPHTATNGTISARSGGNPNLQPEIANTLTAGVVFQPAMLPGFSVSADYYKLKIRDALTQLSVLEVVQDCENSGGTGPSCSLITRPLPFSNRTAANYPTSVLAAPVNAALYSQEGIDLEANYRAAEFLGGSLQVRALMNYVFSVVAQTTAASPAVNVVGTVSTPTTPNLPKWRATLAATYQRGRATLYVQERWIADYDVIDPANPTRSVFANAKKLLPVMYYTDATLSYDLDRWGGDQQLFVSITNLFNRKPYLFAPTALPTNTYPTLQQYYDVVGRYYTAGVRFRF